MNKRKQRARRSWMGLHTVPVQTRHGEQAGIEPVDLKSTGGQPAEVTCTDYAPEQAVSQRVTDLAAFLKEHRPAWSKVRWIHVEGLEDLNAIRALAEKYGLHPLAIEDLLHVPQRPKVELYAAHDNNPARVFVIARNVRMVREANGDRPVGTQLSLFLGHHTLLTFQERLDAEPIDLPGSAQNESVGDNLFDPIRKRIATEGSRLRLNDVSFLMYAILDTLVDNFFPILEHYSDRLEDLEAAVLEHPEVGVSRQIHMAKRELLLLRRAAWPMREVIAGLTRESHDCLSEATRTYLRDVYDHIVQIIDMIETDHEFASGLTETYMNAMSNRMNEIMKVLTIFTTIFVPLTFLAGVYGMNLKYIPELDWQWSYPAFWAVCIVVAGCMLVWFRRKGWL